MEIIPFSNINTTYEHEKALIPLWKFRLRRQHVQTMKIFGNMFNTMQTSERAKIL